MRSTFYSTDELLKALLIDIWTCTKTVFLLCKIKRTNKHFWVEGIQIKLWALLVPYLILLVDSQHLRKIAEIWLNASLLL